MPTILLADDDRLIGAALRRCIESFSIGVRSAHTVESAVRIARHNSFDAILLEFDLDSQRKANPRSGGGLRVLHTLRTAGIATPVLVMSALTRDLYERKCLESGADDFVVKADGVARLIDRLRSQIRGVVGKPVVAASNGHRIIQ